MQEGVDLLTSIESNPDKCCRKRSRDLWDATFEMINGSVATWVSSYSSPDADGAPWAETALAAVCRIL